MLHRPEVLLGNQGREVGRELQILKEQGIVSKVGVSIYSPEILTAILRVFEVDIIQVPFNLFDQQVLSSGWSDKLKSNGGRNPYKISVSARHIINAKDQVCPNIS